MSILPDFYYRGYRPLVPVIPPDATIHEDSRVDPSQRGKCPGLPRGDGTWMGFNFLSRDIDDPARLQAIEAAGANFGIRADLFPGVDIDVDDPTLAQGLTKILQAKLGEAPVRLSKEPRRLLVYRSEEPLPRVSLTMVKGEEKHAVELLSKDRQYLVRGTHPSGSVYMFENGVCRPEELHVITAEQVEQVFNEIKPNLEQLGWEVTVKVDGERDSAPPTPQDDLVAPSLEELEAAVRAVPNNHLFPSRTSYVTFGTAIKAAGAQWPDAAEALFQEWAGRWEEGSNDPDTVAADWGRMRPPFRVGWSYILGFSGERRAQELFKPNPDLVPQEATPSRDFHEVELTDSWVLERVRDRVEGRLLFDHARSAWLRWSGVRWATLPDGEVQEMFRSDILRPFCVRLHSIGEAAGKEGARYITAARKYQNRKGITDIDAMSRNLVGVSLSDFDADPRLLNTPTGVVDLESGEQSPPDQTRLVTRVTAVAPQPRPYAPGDAPLWEQFLADTTGGSAAYVEYLQRLGGYFLTGEMMDKSLYYCWGGTDTGKSTFIRVLEGILGTEEGVGYADTVPISALVGKNRGIPAELAKVAGARLVTATEPSVGMVWDEERVKAITGGDRITVRFLYGNPFSYNPAYKILIVGNHEPEIQTADDAMLRRIKIVPMTRRVPVEKQIAGLDQLIVEQEGPAVLRWMIEGAAKMLAHGLPLPKEVADATVEYGEAEDMQERFIQEVCVIEPDGEVTRRDMYDAWKRFCRWQEVEPGTFKQFRRLFRAKEREHDFTNTQIGDQRLAGYRGIRLQDPEGLNFQVRT